MSNPANQIEIFVQFAEEKLKNHLSELNTRYWYEGQERVSEDTRRNAYYDHRRIFERELDEKMGSLLSDENNSWLKGDLDNAKQNYLDKLLPGQ